MLQIIVFSFNRALQLDTLLATMLEHWKSPKFTLDVIYNTSSPDYQKAYNLLISKMKPYSNIKFHKEEVCSPSVSIKELANAHNLKFWFNNSIRSKKIKTNFRQLCISILEKTSAEHVMFMTDDAMFIDDVAIGSNTLKWISQDTLHNQYSLRVGIGMDDKDAHYIDNGDYLEWNFDKEKGSTNWGYHFSVDAHIYSKDVVLRLFNNLLFANPNTLEGPCREYARRRGWLNNGRGPRHTKLLSFPINMVQTVSSNETLGVSIEKMNQYYLDGYTMRYPIPEKPNHFQHYPHTLFFYKGEEHKEINMVD